MDKQSVKKVKVMFSYQPSNDDELKLEVDDIVEVLDESEIEDGWQKGRLKGAVGVFPSNFVTPLDGEPEVKKEDKNETNIDSDVIDGSVLSSSKEIKPKQVKGVGLGTQIFQDAKVILRPTSGTDKNISNIKRISANFEQDAPKLPPKPGRDLAKVLFSYEAQNADELSLKEGDIISIITKDCEDKGWWKGELSGKVGVFPDNFVELIKVEDAQQPKKPNRPEKPPATVLVKPNIKPEKPPPPDPTLLEKIQTPPWVKTPKAPPVKPPPPEQGDKEKIGVTTPPLPGKKPPPGKKPQRSNSGNAYGKIILPTPSEPPPVPSHGSSIETTPINIPNDSLNSSIDDNPFDSVESSPEKLTHLTAARAKVPNRRPPSHIFLKENDKENGDIIISEKNGDIKSSSHFQVDGHSKKDFKSEKETKQLSTINITCKSTVIKSQSIKENSIFKEKDDIKPLPIAKPMAAVPFMMQQMSPVSPQSCSSEKSQSSPSEDIPSSHDYNIELNELRVELQSLKENSVSKKEYEETKKEVAILKDIVEGLRNNHSRIVRELTREIDDSKKRIVTMQIEIERLKKITSTV